MYSTHFRRIRRDTDLVTSSSSFSELSLKVSLRFFNSFLNICFFINALYYLYDVPAGAERGGHAHKKLQQFLVALSGSFDVLLNDGKVEKTVTLNKPFEGLLITKGIWRELKNFSSGAVCLVVASEVFEETDYIRDFEDFLALSTK